jgi:hypothetical protein
MKLFEQPEPRLRGKFGGNSARSRKSKKKDKKLRNKSIRNALKRNFEYGKELLNQAFGWEF